MQHWRNGELVSSKPLEPVPRCALSIQGRPWMFESDVCVNGLAHGAGFAASVDGDQIVLDGRFVLGRLVEGEIISLKLGDT